VRRVRKNRLNNVRCLIDRARLRASKAQSVFLLVFRD